MSQDEQSAAVPPAAPRRDADGRVGIPHAEEMSEAGLLAEITPLLPQQPEVLVGPGDDAAVLELPEPRLVISTDTLSEGRDFFLGSTTSAWLGRKSAIQNLADIAAMGARPLAVVSALSGPPELLARASRGIARGLAEACATHGTSVIGGDLGAADKLSLTVTAVGSLPAEQVPVPRSGARPGDLLLLAAQHLGGSAAGLALVLGERILRLPGALDLTPPQHAEQAAQQDSPGRSADPLLELRVPAALRAVAAEKLAWHNAPAPDIAAGWRDAVRLHAMIDLSDGLVRDGGRLARASGLSLTLDAAAVTALAEEHAALAAELGADPLHWVLHGGEEHAMLAAVSPQEAQHLPPPWQPIGRFAALRGSEAPGRVRLGDQPLEDSGWDHFGPHQRTARAQS